MIPLCNQKSIYIVFQVIATALSDTLDNILTFPVFLRLQGKTCFPAPNQKRLPIFGHSYICNLTLTLNVEYLRTGAWNCTARALKPTSLQFHRRHSACFCSIIWSFPQELLKKAFIWYFSVQLLVMWELEMKHKVKLPVGTLHHLKP